METALDVLSRAATMVQDNANETRLTAKELPTTDWRRKRRARAGGEYVHSMHGSSSPLNVLANASPPCSPGASIPTAVAHRVHFYPHVPATRYPSSLHYQTMTHHTSPIMLPTQTSVAVANVVAGAPVSSITSPSPSPTSSTSSLSQTSLLMAANLQQQPTTYVPQAHRRSHAGAGAAELRVDDNDDDDDDEQNLDRPLDMSVSSALLKQQRESPPPPYREPMPGSCYGLAALARPSVITQAPPKRNDMQNLEGENDGGKSIVLKTQATTTADDDPTSSLCETVIDEHFRRSLGADYLALFANNKSVANDNNYFEQPAPLQLTTTTKSTTPPPSSPLTTRALTPTEPISLQQSFPVKVTGAGTPTPTPTPATTTVEQPLTLVMTKATITETTTTTNTNTNTTTDGMSETKRYGKHKIAYMQQKTNQNYYQQQQQQQQQQQVETTTTDEALSLIQPRASAVQSPQAAAVYVKKKVCNNIVKVEPHAPICDIVAEENAIANTAATVKAESPTSNATVSEEASVDDHFAKALGDKWKELQTSKNLRK